MASSSGSRSIRLRSSEVLERIKYALRNKEPFSLVRVGDGENIVLAQNTVMTLQQVLMTKWGTLANRSRSLKGLTLPNLKMRDLMVDAIRKASVVGVLDYDDDVILADPGFKRSLTDKVFGYFDLQPRYTCNALFCRYVVKDPGFWEMLRDYKVAIVTRDPDELAELLKVKPYRQQIAGKVSFSHYDQLESVMEELKENSDYFDVALIACGVNAVVLAQRVADELGKVGIDIGKGLTRMLS